MLQKQSQNFSNFNFLLFIDLFTTYAIHLMIADRHLCLCRMAQVDGTIFMCYVVAFEEERESQIAQWVLNFHLEHFYSHFIDQNKLSQTATANNLEVVREDSSNHMPAVEKNNNKTKNGHIAPMATTVYFSSKLILFSLKCENYYLVNMLT